MYTWKKRLLAAILAGCLSVGLMTPALAVEGEATQPTPTPEVTESVAPTDEMDPGFSVEPTTQPTETPAETPSAEPSPETSEPAETPSADPSPETSEPAETPSAEPSPETSEPAETPSADPSPETSEPAETPSADPSPEVTEPAETPSAEPSPETSEPAETPSAEPSPEVTEIPEETVPGGALPEGEFDVAAAYEYLMSLEDDAAIEAYALTLTEEQLEELRAYIMEKELENYTPPETVVVTDAGPFLPPVEVEPFVEPKLAVAPMQRAMMAMSFNLDTSNTSNGVEPLDVNPDNGLELAKKAEKNADGSYTITLNAYTTGKVKTETSTTPVDIVLVLDQSGSMTDDFNGVTRQAAMKEAVQGFINSVAANYDEEKSDHRIAIVTFAGSASLLQGWTEVNVEGTNTLTERVGDLSSRPSGSTNIGAGMEQAENLMNQPYTGTNTTRQRVVVVFTDGVPTKSSDFDTDVANSAIQSAKRLKDQRVTIYSIGIFSGANPNELYGASGFDTNSNGTVNSQWIKDTWGLFPGTDFPEADRPAGNRFLNYLSSNYEGAENVGLDRKTTGLGIFHYKITYTITDSFDRTSGDDQYYLTANDAASLNEIFEKISNSVGSPTIDLNSETVVRDEVTQYFEIPAGGQVNLYTAPCNGGDKTSGFTFGERTPYTDGSVSVDGNVVEVTGFDFNANYVAKDEVTGEFRGNELIIEFTVQAKDGFWGGNQVPTNEATSGVYTADDTSVEAFEVPRVDVPVTVPTMIGKDAHIYGGNTAPTAEKLLNPGSIPNDWRTAYVNVTCVANNTISNVDDGNYTITVTATPKYSGNESAKTNTANAKVNVYMPTLTFQDTQLASGEEVNYDEQNYVSVRWLHDGTEANPSFMTGFEPELKLTYNPTSEKLIVGDNPVDVTVKNGDVDLTAYVTFIRKACNVDGCGNQTDSTHGGAMADPEFVVHIYLPEFVLTIVKNVDKLLTGQDFLFWICGPNGKIPVLMDASKFTGTQGTITITLPSGSYTVEEDTAYSWRYEVVGADSVAGVSSEQTVTFTNKLKENDPGDKWLTGHDEINNIFKVTVPVTGASTLNSLDAMLPKSTAPKDDGSDEDQPDNDQPDDLPDMTNAEGGAEHV